MASIVEFEDKKEKKETLGSPTSSSSTPSSFIGFLTPDTYPDVILEVYFEYTAEEEEEEEEDIPNEDDLQTTANVTAVANVNPEEEREDSKEVSSQQIEEGKIPPSQGEELDSKSTQKQLDPTLAGRRRREISPDGTRTKRSKRDGVSTRRTGKKGEKAEGSLKGTKRKRTPSSPLAESIIVALKSSLSPPLPSHPPPPPPPPQTKRRKTNVIQPKDDLSGVSETSNKSTALPEEIQDEGVRESPILNPVSHSASINRAHSATKDTTPAKPEDTCAEAPCRLLCHQLNAHRAVLQAASGYFAAMLAVPGPLKSQEDTRDWRESREKVIELRETDPQAVSVFPDFRDYLYDPAFHRLTLENVFGLHVLGDKYMVRRLQDHVQEFLSKHIRSYTIFSLLDFAQVYDIAPLRRKCIDWIRRNIGIFFSQFLTEEAEEVSSSTYGLESDTVEELLPLFTKTPACFTGPGFIQTYTSSTSRIKSTSRSWLQCIPGIHQHPLSMLHREKECLSDHLCLDYRMIKRMLDPSSNMESSPLHVFDEDQVFYYVWCLVMTGRICHLRDQEPIRTILDMEEHEHKAFSSSVTTTTTTGSTVVSFDDRFFCNLVSCSTKHLQYREYVQLFECIRLRYCTFPFVYFLVSEMCSSEVHRDLGRFLMQKLAMVQTFDLHTPLRPYHALSRDKSLTWSFPLSHIKGKQWYPTKELSFNTKKTSTSSSNQKWGWTVQFRYTTSTVTTTIPLPSPCSSPSSPCTVTSTTTKIESDLEDDTSCPPTLATPESVSSHTHSHKCCTKGDLEENKQSTGQQDQSEEESQKRDAAGRRTEKDEEQVIVTEKHHIEISLKASNYPSPQTSIPLPPSLASKIGANDSYPDRSVRVLAFLFFRQSRTDLDSGEEVCCTKPFEFFFHSRPPTSSPSSASSYSAPQLHSGGGSGGNDIGGTGATPQGGFCSSSSSTTRYTNGGICEKIPIPTDLHQLFRRGLDVTVSIHLKFAPSNCDCFSCYTDPSFLAI